MSGLIDYAGWLVLVGLVLVVIHHMHGARLLLALTRRDVETCRSVMQALTIRWRWSRLARHLRLVLVDRTRAERGISPGQPAPKPRIVVPRLRLVPDAYGITATMRTVPGVGLDEVQAAARHLSDAWRCIRLSISQPKPGTLRIRAVRRDPLTIPTSVCPDPAAVPGDLRAVYIADDEYADPVDLRLDGVSGVCVSGLPGTGKTTLITGLVARLAPSPAVQFVGLDGKVDDPTQGDYAELADRFAVLLGDDLEAAHRVLSELDALRRSRSSSARLLLGSTNMWQHGPTEAWPLVVLVIDECSTFFRQVRDGGDAVLKRRNVLAAQCIAYVEELVRKGRSAGFLTILLTQKGTGDAIPTSIRDVCALSLAFAAKTEEAAVAALGDDIRRYPDMSPVTLQDARYIGVAVMAAPGRAGYVRVRVPYVAPADAARVTQATRHLVTARGVLPSAPTGPSVLKP